MSLLIKTIVVFNPFYQLNKSVIGNEMFKRVFKIKICKSLVSKLTNISNFQPLELLGRGSEQNFN